MHDLLEVSPAIIIQQISIKSTPKYRICELFSSNNLLSPFFAKHIYKSCSKIEITLVCKNEADLTHAKEISLEVFNLPHVNIIFVKSIDELADNYFDVLFANLSSYTKDLGQYGNDTGTKNIADCFITTLSKKTKTLSLYADKAFLHGSDYSDSRKLLSTYHINSIIDFNKFRVDNAKYEIIHLTVKVEQRPNERLQVIFTPTKKVTIQKQTDVTDPGLPNWVLYIDETFKTILSKMVTGIFNVNRDRQINNSMLSSKNISGAVPVIKAKHLSTNAEQIEPEFNADPFYINEPTLEKLAVKRFLNSDNVFLCPNMTPHIRIFKKPHGYLMNSSVCILTPKSPETRITDDDLAFWRSEEFLEFYKVARNRSQLNLNIDKSAAFYFGTLKQ